MRSPASIALFLVKADPILAAVSYSHNMKDGCKLLITNDSYRLSNIGRLNNFGPAGDRKVVHQLEINPLFGGQNQ
jgi:hypothetical protein